MRTVSCHGRGGGRAPCQELLGANLQLGGDGLAGPESHEKVIQSYEKVIQSYEVQARHECICAKDVDRGCDVGGKEAQAGSGSAWPSMH